MPNAIAYCDLIDADPPPRELGPIAQRYVRTTATWFWLALASVFVTLPAVFVAAAAPRVETIAPATVILAATLALARHVARRRARLQRIVVEGEQRPARVISAHELLLQRGFARARRMTVLLEVDGHPVRLRSWNGDLDGAAPGLWIRVLRHPDSPDLVVPVVSVT